MDRTQFPKHFLWGAATASFQVEGGILNVDWAEAAREGKVPAAGRACEHYTRFAEDFDIAKNLSHNAHRFSLEWARIEPEEGKFNEEAIAHYIEVLKALQARGLVPFVTLWHFTQPLWFVKKGGFESADASEIFARYCAYAVSKLSPHCTYFATINEPYVWAGNGYGQAKWPPFIKSKLRFWNLSKKLASVHAQAYREIKKINPAAQVGVVKHNIYFHASDIVGKVIAACKHWFWNERFLNRAKRLESLDFIGLNYYFHSDSSILRKKDALVFKKSDMHWDIYPEGLQYLLEDLKKYNTSVYVTENGIADSADSLRAEFITAHIESMKAAMRNGVPVLGYFYWSLLDNYEWAEGYKQRFGLVEVNYDTMERKIRPSAYVYADIIRNSAT